MLIEYSTLTGGYVLIDPDLACLPALIGNDSRPVFLYDFVEVLDGLIDYDSVRDALPTLSFAQIDGAVAFIKKLAQLNAREIDIDELENEADVQNVELVNALRAAHSDRETSRVLNND
jgi:hypothetical protein